MTPKAPNPISSLRTKDRARAHKSITFTVIGPSKRARSSILFWIGARKHKKDIDYKSWEDQQFQSTVCLKGKEKIEMLFLAFLEY